MENLLAKMREIKNDTTINWSLFFYKKRRTTNQNPFLTYSWTITKQSAIKELVDDIIGSMTIKYEKDDYIVRDYTPNNDKFVIDRCETTSRLIADIFNKFIESVADSKAYSTTVEKVNGYIIKGVRKSDDGTKDNYFFVGIGTPLKTYKHTFANESIMREVRNEFIKIKPFFDIFISNTTCYLDGVYAQRFFDLLTVHRANMNRTHELLAKTDMIVNLPEMYPKNGKSVFTDIVTCTPDVGAALRYYMDRKNTDPDNEHYRALKIINGKFDAGDLECYLTLIDLLSGRIRSEGLWLGEVRPINVKFSPPQTNHRGQSQ